MKYDYAVIGGGVAGASTALILARHGYSVAIIEKGERIAGLVRGFQRHGLQFDTGFHYAGGLGEGECFDLLCRYLGIADRLEKEPLDAEAFDTIRCRRPDFEFRFACGPGRLQERLTDAFPQNRTAIAGYLQEIDRSCASFPFLNVDAGFSATLDRGETLQEVLDRLTDNRLLQGVLTAHTLLHGVPPRQAPFALHALVVGPYYQSAHKLKGGGKNLAEAYAAELSRYGIDLYLGQGAAAIELAPGGLPESVRMAGGRRIACGGCVFTAHPRLLADLLPEGVFRPAYRKRLRGMAETPSAGLLFGGADTLPEPLAGGNLFLLEEPESAGSFENEEPTGGPLYLTAASPAAGEGKGFLALAPFSPDFPEAWAQTTTGKRPGDYVEAKARMVQKMICRITDFYPDFPARTRWSEGATALTLRDYGHTPTGSLYGVSHRAGQLGLHSPTRVPGLYLAGQALAAPGVMGAMTSAFLACAHIVGHERIQKDLRACR
ncbi:MAG: NAD(P)/FAD-dependent oxidoreductase [Desulfuromonadales bacterium]